MNLKSYYKSLKEIKCCLIKLSLSHPFVSCKRVRLLILVQYASSSFGILLEPHHYFLQAVFLSFLPFIPIIKFFLVDVKTPFLLTRVKKLSLLVSWEIQLKVSKNSTASTLSQFIIYILVIFFDFYSSFFSSLRSLI